MGDFTDRIIKSGNGADPLKAAAVGATHYKLDELSFYINRSPREILSEVVGAQIKQLQDTGQFAAAQELTKNPQPFFGNPHAMAVFMATAIEIKKANARIEKLENALSVIAEAIMEERDMDRDSWFRDLLRPAAKEALAAVNAEALETLERQEGP